MENKEKDLKKLRIKRKYARENRKARILSKIASISAFTIGMVFFALLGLAMPIRPKVSNMENRSLASFPKWSFASMIDGSYFTSISEWYSDSYPLRDSWMKGNDGMKDLYGIRTVQIIQGDSTKDEIPDAPFQDTKAPEETQPIEVASNSSQTEAASPADEPTEAVAAQTETAEVVNTQAEAPAESTQPTEAVTMAAITGQAQNGLFVNGDTAYGLYYFNRQSADTYISTVNRTAERLAGVAQVYNILVPNSSVFYLSEETIKTTDSSDQKQAMEYYISSFNSLVTPVSIYDTLNAHRGEYIYYRTDHHWTALGAYYAYREWATAKGIEPHELSEYEEKIMPGFLGSYYKTSKAAAMEANPDTVYAYKPLTVETMTFTQTDGQQLNWPIINDVASYTCFAGADNPYSIINNPNVTNGQSCVVIKESYGNAMIPFLADHYQTIYWFDYRYYNGDIIGFIRENGVNDVIFVNGTEPITSIESMQRMSGLFP